MKYHFLILLIFITACVRYEIPEENYTEYNPEEDLKALEEAKQQRENLSKAWEAETTTKNPITPEDNCKEVLQQLKKVVTTERNCIKHSDCALASIAFGCIGDNLPVNKNAMQSTLPLFKYLDEHCSIEKCDYRNTWMSVACVHNICTAVARTG